MLLKRDSHLLPFLQFDTGRERALMSPRIIIWLLLIKLIFHPRSKNIYERFTLWIRHSATVKMSGMEAWNRSEKDQSHLTGYSSKDLRLLGAYVQPRFAEVALQIWGFPLWVCTKTAAAAACEQAFAGWWPQVDLAVSFRHYQQGRGHPRGCCSPLALEMQCVLWCNPMHLELCTPQAPSTLPFSKTKITALKLPLRSVLE